MELTISELIDINHPTIHILRVYQQTGKPTAPQYLLASRIAAIAGVTEAELDDIFADSDLYPLYFLTWANVAGSESIKRFIASDALYDLFARDGAPLMPVGLHSHARYRRIHLFSSLLCARYNVGWCMIKLRFALPGVYYLFVTRTSSDSEFVISTANVNGMQLTNLYSWDCSDRAIESVASYLWNYFAGRAEPRDDGHPAAITIGTYALWEVVKCIDDCVTHHESAARATSQPDE